MGERGLRGLVNEALGELEGTRDEPRGVPAPEACTEPADVRDEPARVRGEHEGDDYGRERDEDDEGYDGGRHGDDDSGGGGDSGGDRDYHVTGIVRGADQRPLAGARVVVWWQQMRSRTELAKGDTSQHGHYHLRYRPPRDLLSPLLIVVAAVSEHLDAPLTSSPTPAQPSLEIDLSVEPVDRSEWATLVRSISPLLDGVALDQLVEDQSHHDIAFLSQELSQSPDVIMRVAVSARLETAYSIPAPAFYAFLRRRVPAALPNPLLGASDEFALIDSLVQKIASLIFGLSPELQTQTLTSAVALDLIGQQFTAQIAGIVAQLQAHRTSHLLDQPFLVGNTTLSQLLDLTGIDSAKKQTFAQALTANTGSMRNFWRNLTAGKGPLTAADASSIERTLSIGSFVKNFTPLMQTLLQDFANGTYKSLADLARLSRQDWIDMVNQTGAPPGINAAGSRTPAEVFAGVIYTRVTRAYPTAALSSRIATEGFVPPSMRAPLTEFFTANPSLELLKDGIPEYVAAHPGALANIPADQRQAVVTHARSFQRVLRVAPRADTAQSLLAAGFTSATQINALGRQQFFEQATAAGLTKTEANLAFSAAAQRYASVIALYMQLNAGAIGLLPRGIGNLGGITGSTGGAVDKDPTLATLFGSQDYCATDECTSVLSPAAYLCDLLLWLRNRGQGNHTALDVVDSRRPDVRHLLLNCPNTDTELPYVDLVIELLADAISPPVDTVATSYVQSALTDGTTYYYIVTAVNAIGESAASAQASVTPQAATALPAAPAGVTATAGDKQVTLAWPPVTGATGYNLYYSTNQGLTTATASKVASVSSPYAQAGLTDGTTYYYLVTTVNAIGESAASAEVSATPQAPTAVPAAPAGLAATAGDAEVALSWSPVSGATSYNIYWSTNPGVSTGDGNKLISDTASYLQAALVDGTTYYYLVTAVNAIGEGTASAEISATPQAPTAVPNAPTGLIATAGDQQVTLTWDPVAGATSYNIYWSTTPGVTTHTGTVITGARNPKWKQTSAQATAEQMRAAPEYFNQGAFAALAQASYPFILPYSAGLDELRTYVKQLGLPLWQLRQALLPLAGGATAQLAAVTAERLQLSSHAADLIANANFVPTPVAWNTPASANPVLYLSSVPAFLQAASITYESLLELLEVAWVQGGLGVGIDGIDSMCSTSAMTLSPLDAGFLDRAHRFLRLWLATGYKMWELDLLLGSAAVGGGALSQSTLAELLAFQQLRDATRLSVDQLLAFYQNLDTATHRDPGGVTTTSLYAQVFLNATVAAVAPDPDLAAVASGGTIADPALSDHVAPIQAALGVSAADAATLLGLTDDTLSLSNLTLIYRVSLLARAANLSISNLVTVATLLTPGAASAAAALAQLFASPAATLEFLSQATAIRQSALSLDALTYLLTPPSATTLTAAITATQTSITVAGSAAFPSANFYVAIGAEVLLVTAVGGAGNTTWTVLRGQQGTTAAAAANGAEIDLVGGWPTSTQMTQAQIAGALGSVQQAVAGMLDTNTTLAAAIDATATSLTVVSAAGFPAPPFAVAIGSEILSVTAVGGAGNTTWTVVRGQQGTTAAPAASGAALTPTGGDVNGMTIAAVAANAHGTGGAPLANDVTAQILDQLVLPGTTRSLLAVLTDPAFTGATTAITAANFPAQFLAVQLFDKVAVLVRALHLVASDLGWLLANAGAYGGLSFAGLPVTVGQAPLELGPLLSMLLLIKLARLWTAAPPASTIQTLYDLISGITVGSLADAAAAQTQLAEITGWPLIDIGAFAAALGLAFPADYTKPAAYDSLRTLEAMAGTARATGAQLVDWSTVPPDEMTAEGMAGGALGVVKAQQATDAAWLALAPTLMNPIRDRRSPALQAYLLARRDASGDLVYANADALFGHFLIDVQMTSCQVTSRIVQAYIAVQIFVERCLLNLEAPQVVVDPNDTTWQQWSWMHSYRVWEANREVFLYPENWLIESQRPNRTELYETFEQQIHQGQSTADYLETVVLNYVGGLDGLAHLVVTGTCEDAATGDLYVVARGASEPPTYYVRSYANGAWSGWSQIPINMKAQQVVPAVYRRHLCLFWLELSVSNEPQQTVPPAQASSSAPNQAHDRYVALSVHFSMFSNDAWQPPQSARGKLFDKPFYGETVAWSAAQTEALYTVKVQAPAVQGGYGANLWVDVFRRGDLQSATLTEQIDLGFLSVTGGPWSLITGVDDSSAVHVGRAVFDGRFTELELRNLPVPTVPLIAAAPIAALFGAVADDPLAIPLLGHAQVTYGLDAQPLLPLPDGAADPDLVSDSGLVPMAGALISPPSDPTAGQDQRFQLEFTAASSLEQNVGPLLRAAPVPARVVGPDSDLGFDPGSYFFFQDSRRCYWVQSQRNYWTGSAWAPITPSYPATAPYELKYWFHVFYHPFTGLLWNQLAGGGFDALYDANLQQNPDQIDPSGADVFGFSAAYQPVAPPVRWDHDDVTGQDRQFLDFSLGSAYGVYNWELFYHVPLYVAQLLSQNQQFEDAQRWFQYIFNPTRQSSDPVPGRYWIPKPLHNLTSAQVQQQNIANLLQGVNQGDPNAVAMVQAWRSDPFNPFVLADLRPVAYMKSAVMSHLDNLIAWGDNLFSTESREALSEATLLYVLADEVLGPAPNAVTPPEHADESFDQLEPALDAFANALVEIENVIGGTGAMNGGGSSGDGIPQAQTFYFTIPPNVKLLGYWTTVADRLYKLRHCQSITGAPLQLALFDAPIDPGLLIAAQTAGVDLSSVFTASSVALPNYRFTVQYSQALDFVNAVRAYGSALQAALEKIDAGALTLLQQALQQQLLADGDQVLEWQVGQAQHNLDALNASLQLAQQKVAFNGSQDVNAAEITGTTLIAAASITKAIVAAIQTAGGVAAIAPDFTIGVAGFGGTPVAVATDGGTHAARTAHHSAQAIITGIADILSASGALANTIGNWQHRQDNWTEAKEEAQTQVTQAEAQIAAAEVALQIAEQNQALHQEQIDDLQKQIDFLNDKFTSNSLYQWMVGSLSASYFQSYQLAYQLCKQVERCYQFELGIPDSSFIQFGYWDSLHKGLLAGEALNHDLRRLQASYLQQNSRRYELSRNVSLAVVDPVALQQLLKTGACDFTLPESLFDNDYPGHYNRRLTRVSVTVVYPSPGKFDNVKATLTLVANQVRVATDVSSGYPEGSAGAVGSDPRFVYNYAAVPQKIALGNAQDDPGLFVTAIASNITDQRYLPFENAGAISSWHLEMPAATNEVDLSTVGDIVLHLYYTALDGGGELEQAVQTYNASNVPTSGVKVFSAQNDFPAPAPTNANPYPQSPWQVFLSTVTAPANQTLTLNISPSKFPAWTRGKTISVSSITVLALAWPQTPFVLVPQAPLPTATLTMNPLSGVSEPFVYAATIALPPGTPLGTWSLELQQQGAADFRSLTRNMIGDALLVIDYTVS